MGMENEYNSFIATCSLGFLVAFLQEKERSFPFEIKQLRYFHLVTEFSCFESVPLILMLFSKYISVLELSTFQKTKGSLELQ